MSEKITIVKIEMTCDGCPSQWEAETSDGKYVYMRYRWGGFTVSMADNEDKIFTSDAIILFREQLGDALDGVLTDREMQLVLRNIFDFKLTRKTTT